MWTTYILLIILFLAFWGETRRFKRLGRMVRAARRRKVDEAAELPPISVVLTVKDQYELLQHNLPMFLTQDYPEYEVWVVDSSDNDEARWLTATLADTYPNLHYTQLRPTRALISEPCLAYTLGFRAASYDWVMLSRIDCFPPSNQWLKQMGRTAARLPKRKIIAGYTRFERPSTRWAGLRLRFYHVWQQMLMLPFSISARLHMADGTNVMYRKSFFMKHHGFQRAEQYTIGIIETLVNQHSTRTNTVTCLHPDAILTRQTPAEAHYWSEERVRQVEIGSHLTHWRMYAVMYLYYTLLPWVYAIGMGYALRVLIDAGQWGMTIGAVVMLLVSVVLAIRSYNYTLTLLGERVIFFRLIPLIYLVPLWHIEARVRHIFTNKAPWRKPTRAAVATKEWPDELT